MKLTQTIPALPVRCELSAREVLHPVSREGVAETDFGTREFAALDFDGNLLTFSKWRRGQ